jgi:hypothetical protein
MTPRIEAIVESALELADQNEGPLVLHVWHSEVNKATEDGAARRDEYWEHAHEVRSAFADALDNLYRATLLLIESRNAPEYLRQFYQKFGEKFDGWRASMAIETDDGTLQPHSVVLRDLRAFLKPLGIGTSANNIKRLGIHYLENILANTESLLRRFNVEAAGELEISRAIRHVIEIVFPTAHNAPQGRFFKLFKHYKPDILVPELSAAVEYKYIDVEQKLGATYGQIAEDAKGYSRDPDYQVFFAVFYFTQDFQGLKRYQHAWDQHNFPPDWRPIFIVGSRPPKR